MALSLAAEEILTEHRSALVKAMKTPGKPNGPAQPQNFGTELRNRMLGELWSHAERASTSHRYRWDRLHQHGTPQDLAALIEKARTAAGDAKEATGKQGTSDEQASMEDRLAAIEEHLLGNGDDRFRPVEQSIDPESPPDVNSPETADGVARLLGHYRGEPLGVEAKHSHRDEHAMTAPDPETRGGARVVTWNESGIKSHSSHPDPHAALAHMVAAGYTDPAPGSYAEHSESPDWNWLHEWAHTTSSGDDTARRRPVTTRPHPRAMRERRADPDRSAQHRDELTAAINELTDR